MALDVSRNFSRRGFLRRMGQCVLGAAAPSLLFQSRNAWSAPKPGKKPNFVFFLVDDMGWMDTTVYGSQYYETPNMERLAKGSMRFTDAYTASPLCSPTRASIMTGQYPARLGLTTACGHLPPKPPDTPRYPEKAAPTHQVICADSLRFVRPEEYTVAEALRDAGYRTGHFGKWHLGLNPEYWPEAQGFEVSIHGVPDPGPKSYFSPYQFKGGTLTDGPVGEYIADRLTDEALKFIDAHRDEPFFVNLWHHNVHGPWGHKEEYTRQFLDKKDPRGKQGNPIMASMLKSVDESLGRILDKLEELGLADSTILIFFSDNGGNTHSNTLNDPKAPKPGAPVPPSRQDYLKWADHMAPTNNDPLREGKGTIYEGGVRVPLMVRWPGVVAPGSKSAGVVCSVDFYPTMLEMAGLTRKEGVILDGESITPLLKADGAMRRDAILLYYPHPGQELPGVAVRQGDWKLIRWFETDPKHPNEHELYNLRDDLSETTNLAAKQPQKVKALRALIDKHLADTHALLPIPNPAYDPNAWPVAGWQALGGCKLSLANGALIVEGKDQRTQMWTADVPQNKGVWTVRLRMRGENGGAAIAYWGDSKAPAFSPDRRADFKPVFDGQWHESEVQFESKNPLAKVRLDVATKPTRVEIDWIRLCDASGAVARAWEFDGK
ncbi:MAG: sulfatase [Candidatus Sumerlaeota bacterium]|nr:sulfatase [Candidatus Sumerlaeota bacterium]